MKVLITGAQGQVGRALARSAPIGADVVALAREALDITDAARVAAIVREIKPNVIINAAAYTAVDRAEAEQDRAAAINVHGPAYLAAAAARAGARLVHISTDYVLAGDRPTPARPTDATEPTNVYGATKLAGEHAVLSALPERSIILRTSWVYAADGHNFVRTMLRLMREKGAVRVVADQFGVPTAASSVADTIWRLIAHDGLRGIFHWCDAGIASWYDFAVAIAEEGFARGLVAGDVEVTPIATAEFPTPARRPAFSVLDCDATVEVTGLRRVHWRTNLRRVLEETSLGGNEDCVGC